VADPPGRATAEGPLTPPPGDELDDLVGLADRLQVAALGRGVTVATAESCTGGLLGHLITAIPGSSGYYLGGVVSYADAVKAALLDVPREALERHGAVSAQVARAMAEGVRGRVGADLGVAVTGVAGPDGGTAAKPVGLTYIAVAGPARTEVQRHAWTGDRKANKARSAEAALHMLIVAIERRDEAEVEEAAQGPGS
jgi:PncC family amidohydrolase